MLKHMNIKHKIISLFTKFDKKQTFFIVSSTSFISKLKLLTKTEQDSSALAGKLSEKKNN